MRAGFLRSNETHVASKCNYLTALPEKKCVSAGQFVFGSGLQHGFYSLSLWQMGWEAQ